jgi:predicted nucleic acid-binding protein
LFQAFHHHLFEIAFAFESETLAIEELMEKYTNVPMSLADACLVRMSELYPQAYILTLDSDFYVYRRNRDQPIPCIMAPKR